MSRDHPHRKRVNLEDVPDESTRPSAGAFDLRTHVEHQLAEYANGPTIAEWLADLDVISSAAPLDVVEELHACRAEREERWDELWPLP